MSITRHDIARLRLFNQRISEPSFLKPDEVVSWLGAVQAQDFAIAKWSLGLRMQDATLKGIDQAFADGAILRTHLLRPTWHFVTPGDIRWMLALTAPRVHAANAHMYRKLELERPLFKRSNAVLAHALRNGKHLTRNELREALQRAGIAIDDALRLVYIIMHAELDGLICSGAPRGKQFTYALLDERAPRPGRLKHEEALAELARRYFASRGPATVQDFAKWSGLTVADARRGLEEVKARLQHEQMDKQVYWFSASKASAKSAMPAAYLLSIYDEYISGYKDRSAIAETEIGAKLSAMGNALRSIILIDGQVIGTWKRALRKDAVVIGTDPFARLTIADTRAVAAAARRYGQFLGLPVVSA